jgi:polysaccharide export outer membrane protein
MRTKPIYSLFCTLALGVYALSIPVMALESEYEETMEASKEQNNSLSSETSPSLRPALPTLKPQTPTNTPLPEIKEYTLSAGDVINVNLFNVDQNVEQKGEEYPVFMDGTVSIPLIGNFKVEGMTIKEVNELFAGEYGRYLKRPLVTVTLKSQRPLQLAIAGEVNNPGNYTIPADPQKQPTITNLVDQAGGLTVSADISQVTLRRTEDGVEEIYVLNFWDLLREGDLKKDIPLRDGDVIIIPTKSEINSFEHRQLTDASFGIKYEEPPHVTLIGEINRPGSYIVGPDQRDETTEFTEPRLTEAIKMAGGIKELADVRNISISRINRDGEEQIIKVDLWDLLQTGDINEDVLLKDGDKITIPTAKKLDPKEAETLATANFSPDKITVQVVGEVEGEGIDKELPPNTSLNKAILSAGGFDERRADQEIVELIRINPNGTVTKREIKVDLAADINEETNPILKDKDVIVVKRNGMTTFTDGLEGFLGPIGRSFSILGFFNLFD